MFWNEWRGSTGERPTFFSRRLLTTWLISIELHKFVGDDVWECYHTHPATAIRIGLKGGYIEQVYRPMSLPVYKVFRALDIGLVFPSTCHRLHSLLNDKEAYTLWIRGPKVKEIKLRGEGWKSVRAMEESA